MDINDKNIAEKPKKLKNYGYICGILMLLLFALLTALIIVLCFGDLKNELTAIFSKPTVWKTLKSLFSFLTDFRKELNFSRVMTTLYYFDIFCLASAILGFVQGAFYKKRL